MNIFVDQLTVRAIGSQHQMFAEQSRQPQQYLPFSSTRVVTIQLFTNRTRTEESSQDVPPAHRGRLSGDCQNDDVKVRKLFGVYSNDRVMGDVRIQSKHRAGLNLPFNSSVGVLTVQRGSDPYRIYSVFLSRAQGRGTTDWHRICWESECVHQIKCNVIFVKMKVALFLQE